MNNRSVMTWGAYAVSVVLAVVSSLPAASAAEVPLEARLTDLSNTFDTRIATMEAEGQTRYSSLTNRYARQLQAILKQKQQMGDLDSVMAINAELDRLAAGNPSADLALFLENAKEIRDAVSNLVFSARELDFSGAKQVVDFATNFTASLLKMQVDLTKRGDIEGGIKVRDTIKALDVREPLKTARQKLAAYEEEKARAAELAQKLKRHEELVSGRLGPFTLKPAPKGKKTLPALKLSVAWDRLQKMDCDYQLYEFFASQPPETVLSLAVDKPDIERIRFLLYMMFNKQTDDNAAEQLKLFRPEDLLDAARATFWPEELYPPRADGAYLWAACASYFTTNTAFHIIHVGFDKQHGNAIKFVSTYRSIPVPPAGFTNVPASSHISRHANRW